MQNGIPTDRIKTPRSQSVGCALAASSGRAAKWNSRNVIQTEAAPPRNGSIILPIIGSQQNRRNALKKIVGANSRMTFKLGASVVVPSSVIAGITLRQLYNT